MDKLKQPGEIPRKQMGFIKFPNRSYPVYEGLNVIGRDSKATVRVKDLTFSKQHATIVVVDDTTHFISDFGSSNGTEFRHQKLIPFKIYEIKDQECITFGDIVAEYHTGADPNLDKENYFNETQSQFMDADATTQLLTHNIHDLPTQQIIIDNKNDKNTKTDTQNIHEAETQQILKTNDGVDSKLLSKPTAILETQNNNTCTEHFADFSRSELYDDIFANESFRQSLANAGSKYHEEVVDETLATDPKLNKSNDVSMDSDDIILSTQDNANIEQHTQQIILKRNKPDSKNDPPNKDDDDSATDIEDEDEFMKKIQQKSTQFNDSKTKNDSVAEEDLAKKFDDSTTDIDDDSIANCEYNIKPSNEEKSQEPQNKMSDENDEALLLVPTQLLDNKKTANSDDESDDDDIDLLAGVQPDLLQEQSNEKDNNDDDLLTKNHENKEPEQHTANKKQIDDDGDKTDDDLLAPTQLLTVTSKNHQNKEPTANKNQDDDDGDETDDDLLAPTQLLTATSKNHQNKELTANKNQINDDGDETDDDLLAPTQLLTATSKNHQNKEPTANKNQDDDDGDETDDDLLAPTQLLTAKPKNHQNKELTANKDQADDDGDETDDDLLAPTQLLTASPNNHQNKKPGQPTANKNQVDDDGDDTDDDLLAPTQLLGTKSNDKAPEKTNNDSATKISDNKADDDDDLLAPTQLLSGKSNKNDFAPKPINDDDSLAPTQLLESKNVQNNAEVIDDDDLPPTQLLSNEPKNANDSIFSAPTQILEKPQFASPKSILSIKSPKIKPKRSVNFSEDLIYDMPTQQLNTSGDTNIYEAPTQLLENVHEAPTQFLENKQSIENVHDAPTQLLEDNKNKTSSDSSSLEEPFNNTQGSENTSLKLVLSETDDECSDLSKINQFDTKTSSNLQPETQLEVDFDLETQKLYVEEKTSRPDNPLGHMFAEEPTQMTEDIIENKPEPNTEENKPKPKFEDIETSRRLQVKLSKRIDLTEDKSESKREENKPEPKMEDIKTSKRLQVKRNNKVDMSEDKSEQKHEENIPEPKIEDKESTTRLKVKLSKRMDLTRDQSEPKSEENKPELKIEDIKTSKRLQVKRNNKVEMSENKSEPKHEENMPEPKIEDKETSTRLKVKLSKIIDLTRDKSEPKREENKQQPKIEDIKTSKRLQVKSENKSEPKHEENIPEPKIEDKESSPRLQVKLRNRGDMSEASTSKSNSATSDEADFKAETKRGRSKKQKIEDKIPKLIITKVRHSEVNQKKQQEEKPKESPVKSSETDEDKPHNTRGKRISYQKLNSGKVEPKKSTRGRKKAEEEEVEVKKTSRISARRTTQLQTPKTEVKNDDDLDDFINRVTRSKRTHSVAETPKKKTVAEDSDSDDNIVTKKKVKKLEYTQEAESMCSMNSEVVREKTVKRSMKIENYSSDENTDNTTSFCAETPNTKRRRYEPLNVTLNNTVGSETIKHKVVFTMLSDTTLETSVKKLGGSITDSAQMSTVLVTNKISRSLKFLTAVALGKPIVQAKWIHDSIKKNLFQDPWNYLLEDTESEAKFDFSLKDSLKRSCEKLLLTDMVFLVPGKKNSDVLKEIIETSGGKCVARAPAKNAPAIVVSYEEEKAKYSKYLKQKNLTVVSAEAIFSGVLRQEVNWKQHLLS